MIKKQEKWEKIYYNRRVKWSIKEKNQSKRKKNNKPKKEKGTNYNWII